MLISAPSVYESQPLSDGRKISRACLISCCRFSFLTSPLWIFPSPGVLLFLSRALFYELCYSLMTYTFMGLLQAWDQSQELGITSGPAPPSPRFEQSFGGFVLVLLLFAEDDPSLDCCLMAVGLGFPSVYPAFFFGTGSLNLCHLFPPRMDVFRSMLQI